MTRSIFLLLFHLMFVGSIVAQSADSSNRITDTTLLRDSSKVDTTIRKDTVIREAPEIVYRPSVNRVTAVADFPGGNFIQHGVQRNHYFAFSSGLSFNVSNRKGFKGKELLFYFLIGLLLFFALIRLSFGKYVVDLFRVAFRTTLKQRQIGEQLVQTPFPSLLLNFFFVITISLYISFVLQHYQLATQYDFRILFLYCFIGIIFIYLLKFLSLKFFGWLFNISATSDGYIFIVFMINKIIGIYILPFLVLIAFTDDGIYQASFILSYLGVFILLAYRYILAYGLIQNQMKLNPFHFFLYLCAFEIIPLLLIYKALLRWF